MANKLTSSIGTVASRPPTDRSAEAVARAWCRERGWSHVAEGDEDYEDRRRITEIAQLLRARDAAWRRVVRTTVLDDDPRAVIQKRYARDWILAAAPGAHGTKGGRRG